MHYSILVTFDVGRCLVDILLLSFFRTPGAAPDAVRDVNTRWS